MTPESRRSEWSKLPAELQHQFFLRAEVEAKRCRDLLLKKARRIEGLQAQIPWDPLPVDDGWDRLRVAVVDGSNSPSTSERLGVRFGTYCAAYLIFEGKRVVDEGYNAGHLYSEQLGPPEQTQRVLNLLRVSLERDAALACLEKDVDFILIDGSFFGFRAEAHYVKGLELKVEEYDSGQSLVEGLRNKSMRLLRSGKAVGIIKRTRTSALDGWLIYNYGNEDHCVDTNDKDILASILPPGHWFSYERLFKSPTAYNYFSRLRDTYRFLVLKEGKKVSMEDVLQAAKAKVEHDVMDAIGFSAEATLRSSRYYARCCAAPPFEFEAKMDADVKPCLAYFNAFHNPATGLPWPIDLVDENVSLPRGFNKEFVEEVEAKLIKDPAIRDKLKLQQHFSYLNPQKEED